MSSSTSSTVLSHCSLTLLGLIILFSKCSADYVPCFTAFFFTYHTFTLILSLPSPQSEQNSEKFIACIYQFVLSPLLFLIKTYLLKYWVVIIVCHNHFTGLIIFCCLLYPFSFFFLCKIKSFIFI